MRQWLPLEGAAGGFPGETTLYLLYDPEGTTKQISVEAAGVRLLSDQLFEFRCGSGGGVGDPLDRDLSAVFEDVEAELLATEDAEEVYGLVLDDEGRVDDAASRRLRERIRKRRLTDARPPLRFVDRATADAAVVR